MWRNLFVINIKSYKEMKKTIINLVLFLLLLLTVNTITAQSTYTVNGTNYIYGEYYETGYPKVKRNQANVDKFLKSIGYSFIPAGYQVDHIIPLSQGGTDTPSNMQLISIEQHKMKTAHEKKSSTKIYTNKSSYNLFNQFNKYNYSNSNYTVPKSNYNVTYSAPKTIYTGPRGGKYYINGNGNKTYLKKYNFQKIK